MKNGTIAVLILSFMTAAAFATDSSAVGSAAAKHPGPAAASRGSGKGKPLSEEVRSQVDAINNETLDIEAMYWAWRTTAKDPSYEKVTYEELEINSRNWVLAPGTRKLFLAKLKEILDSNASRPLTAAEEKKRLESKARIRRLLSSTGNEKRSGDATSAGDAKKEDSRLDERLPRVDAVQREGLDIDVMYWAWRITDTKDLTYKELEAYSKNWVMAPETKKLFLAKLKKILDSDTSRPLTEPEWEKHQENMLLIRSLLSPAGNDTALIESLSVDLCVELEARYGALKVLEGENKIIESMKRWGGGADIHKRITVKINENLEKKLAPLTKEELYKLDACIAKLSKL